MGKIYELFPEDRKEIKEGITSEQTVCKIPVKAVLGYFNLNDVTRLEILVGGHLNFRHFKPCVSYSPFEGGKSMPRPSPLYGIFDGLGFLIVVYAFL